MPKKFKKARLLIPNKTAKDQRWIIKYWCEDSKGVYRMFREVDFNHLSESARQEYAARRIQEINKGLMSGAIADEVYTENNSTYLVDALQNKLDNLLGLRPKTVKNYNDYTKKFIKWLNNNGYTRLFTDRLTVDIIDDFVRFLFDSGLKNRTINNTIEHVSTMMGKAGIQPNPFVNYPKFQTETGRNIAYTEIQQIELKEYIASKDINLLMACKHMYYTLMRPKEMSLLRVGDIAAYHPEQISFNEDISKNRMFRNVTLPKQFEPEILSWLKLFNPKPEWYVFGRGFKPGPNHYPPEQMADSYKKRILTPLKYPADYTYYSWKHTGVVRLYLSGVKTSSIRMQTGHISEKSFETYLKSLGLFDNKEVRDSFPDF